MEPVSHPEIRSSIEANVAVVYSHRFRWFVLGNIEHNTKTLLTIHGTGTLNFYNCRICPWFKMRCINRNAKELLVPFALWVNSKPIGIVFILDSANANLP